MVPNPGIKFDTNATRGRIIIFPKIMSTYSAKAINMREQSLWYLGGKLVNSLPITLRNCTDSLEVFKKNLDLFICNIPDHPATPDLTPEPLNPFTCKNSNSLRDWIKLLKLGDRRLYIETEGPVECDTVQPASY